MELNVGLLRLSSCESDWRVVRSVGEIDIHWPSPERRTELELLITKIATVISGLAISKGKQLGKMRHEGESSLVVVVYKRSLHWRLKLKLQLQLQLKLR